MLCAFGTSCMCFSPISLWVKNKKKRKKKTFWANDAMTH